MVIHLQFFILIFKKMSKKTVANFLQSWLLHNFRLRRLRNAFFFSVDQSFHNSVMTGLEFGPDSYWLDHSKSDNCLHAFLIVFSVQSFL